jgi:hypothetical protein
VGGSFGDSQRLKLKHTFEDLHPSMGLALPWTLDTINNAAYLTDVIKSNQIVREEVYFTSQVLVHH